jgi:hypothetical protein
VDVFRDRYDVLVWNWQGWHSPFCASTANDWKDQFAALIAQHDLRPEQIRPPCRTAAKVGAVARAANTDVHARAALDQHRVARWPLLRRKHARISASPLRQQADSDHRQRAGERRDCKLPHSQPFHDPG